MVHPFLTHADNVLPSGGQSVSARRAVDLLVIGAGVMGLWLVLKAGRAGLKTLLVDAQAPAAGASGGLLGALMAHTPDRWNEKKQFQLDALVQLEEEVARLEAETGLSCGYSRCGRLIPLPKPHLRTIAERNGEDAVLRWQSGERRFDWRVLDAPVDPDWLSSDACGAGLIDDGLAGRVSPRSLVAALVAACDQLPTVSRLDGEAVARLLPGRAILSNGEDIRFGQAVVAAGVGSFGLLDRLGPVLRKPLGRGVKGQAALLKADVPADAPIIYLNGVYVVPHENGTVAIGSTSEEEFDAPFDTDHRLEALVEKARGLCPAIAEAPLVERWAGLRPRAVDRDPMIGPHPDAPNVFALTGGFKVSFGIAHRLADAVLSGMAGQPMLVPGSYVLEHHLKVASAE